MQAAVMKRWTDRKRLDVWQGNVVNYDNKTVGEDVEITVPTF